MNRESLNRISGKELEPLITITIICSNWCKTS